MLSFIVLTLLNLMVLLAPPGSARMLLELMILPFSARLVLLWTVLFNVVLSMAFERWGVEIVAKVVGSFTRLYKDRRRYREGKAYKFLST